MTPKPAFDRGHVHASSSPQQLATPSESRERLVHRRAGSKMQEHLGAYGSAFGQLGSLPQNGFCQAFHGSPSVRSICLLMTLFNEDYVGRREPIPEISRLFALNLADFLLRSLPHIQKEVPAMRTRTGRSCGRWCGSLGVRPNL